MDEKTDGMKCVTDRRLVEGLPFNDEVEDNVEGCSRYLLRFQCTAFTESKGLTRSDKLVDHLLLFPTRSYKGK